MVMAQNCPGVSCTHVLLRHPTQSQYIEADVAHPHRLVQVKLDDGDLLYRALVAQQAATVTAGVKEKTQD